jgi:glycosyltransferase involved in cell wall biosynthesis
MSAPHSPVALLRRLYQRIVPHALRARWSEQRLERRKREHAFARTSRWALPNSDERAVPPAAGPQDGEMLPGVNLVGYFRAQFGLAECARAYARALMAAGIPVAFHDVDLGIPHNRGERSLEHRFGTTLPHPVTILFVNPDYLAQALEEIGPARLQSSYLIGCWFWELERLPESWLPALRQVDEIMVATRFVEQATRAVTDKPVLNVPIPLSPLPDSGLQRADFGLDPEAFVFLFTFDFSSWVWRKNPLAVIAAFKRAFAADQSDVQLLIKSSNGFRHPDWFRLVVDAVDGDPRIMLRDDVIERPHLIALQRCADVYVSLHRAEGFGMGMAESMSMGKPVIATGWSGNMSFMDEHSAALVGYRMIPVKPGQYRDGDGQQWAEADTQQAAEWMRRLADHPEEARQLGERGRAHVEEILSPQRVAATILHRLREIVPPGSPPECSSNPPEIRQ